MRTEKQSFFVLTAWRLGGASVRRAAVTLLLTLLTTTAVWANTETVSYIDAYGESQTVTATVLTGNETPGNWGIALDAGWYVVTSNISYTNTITDSGSGGIHIILADGAEMSISVSSSFAQSAIDFTKSSLAIYGQSDGTGKLTAHTDMGTAIDVISNITINGGIVNATTNSNYCAIESRSDITINGGQVTATGTGIFAKGHTTLGLRKESDFIKANKYDGTVHIKEGLALTDGTNIYSGNGVSIPDNAKLTLGNFIENSDGTYTIGSSTGWNQFCDALQNNTTYNRFSGKIVKLGADISVNRMAGSSNHDFCGTFDGQGHTLTFTSTENVNGVAPFSYISETTPTGGSEVSNPAIRNLNVVADINTTATNASGLVGRMWGTLTIEDCTVSGTIQTSNQFAAGFIAQQNGTANITDCVSGVTIKSSVSGDGTHGGFVALPGGTLNITGSAFTGKLITTNGTTKCGGFVGWYNSKIVSVSNSLYDPADLADGETAITNECATFVRDDDNDATITNCYYTATLGTAQGIHAHRIIAGEKVTVAFAATPTNTYTTSGLSAYGVGKGIAYTPKGSGSVTLYVSSGETVSLKLTNTPPMGYGLNNYTVSPNGTTLEKVGDNYTLAMPDADVTIGAVFTHLFGEGNDGTSEATAYVISNVDGWNFLCDRIANGDNNYRDKYYKLGADISVTNMVGTSNHPFAGTFDGQGHTLTVSYDVTDDYCAPFRYAITVTIRNLHVDGDIYTTKKYAAGVVACVKKYGNISGSVSIENCRSSVTIMDSEQTRSNYYYDAYYGGFVAKNNNGCSTTITDCVFDGNLNGFKVAGGNYKARSCGGFVGSNDGTVSITNSLFAPQGIKHIGSDNSYTFCPNSNGTVTVSNCYYTEVLGTEQGTEGILLYDGGVPATANKGAIGMCKNTEQYEVKLRGRTLYKDGKWNTLCLPFSMTAEQVTAQLAPAQLMTLSLSAFAGGELTLTFEDATTIEAGKPYIIKWEKPEGYDGHESDYDISDPVFTGVTIPSGYTSSRAISAALATASRQTEYVDFCGTFSPEVIYESGTEKTKLYLGSGNTLYYPTTEGFKVNSCRAYFVLKNGLTVGEDDTPEPGSNQTKVRAFNLSFGDEDEETGILSTTDDTDFTDFDDAWYDLSGRKLSGKPSQRGVYIRGGRKIAVQ